MKKINGALNDDLERELKDACKLVCKCFNLKYEELLITYNYRKGNFKIHNVSEVVVGNEGLFNSISMSISNSKLRMRKSKKEETLKIVTLVTLTLNNSFDAKSIAIAVLSFENGKWEITKL